MAREIDGDDYTLSPCGWLGGMTGVSQGGKFLRRFAETGDALAFVREHMESEGFYPSIWWVSDHGNAWQIDLDGNEITGETGEEDAEEFEECEEVDA